MAEDVIAHTEDASFTEAAETVKTLKEGIRSPEVQAENKVITFTDKLGVERRPYDEAPECYASAEIQQEVSNHFEKVESIIEDIEHQLNTLEDPEVKREVSFNPLDDQLLDEIKAVVKGQLPSLTRVETRSVAEQITKGRIFKKTRTIHRSEDVVVPVDGFIVGTDSETQRQYWQSMRYAVNHNGEYVKSGEQVTQLSESAAKLVKQLLTSEERTFKDPSGKRLPLLAKKLLDNGMDLSDIDTLGWDDIERIVPEAKEWFDDIHAVQEILERRDVLEELNKIERELYSASPRGCSTIARIYYDDETLQKLDNINSRIEKMRQDIWAITSPDWKPDENEPSFIERQHQSMAEFFDYAAPADKVLVHGTNSAPRIIRSGYLKPAAGMEDDEFTFNTQRTNIPGAQATASIHGSRAVHWAEAGSGGAYTHNMKFTESVLREDIAQRLHVSPDHPWVDQEVAKGDVGAAMLTMRLGDLVKYTPYGGYADVSFGSKPDRQGLGHRLGVVELTERGEVQFRARAKEGRPSSDVAYIAAPITHGNDELYDYAYPLENMMIGIPAADPDTIPEALRKAGWTEEQIKEHTFVFDKHLGEEDELQADALLNPRYPRSLIATIAQDA